MKKALFNVFLFFLISFSSNAVKLSEVKGLQDLSNYNELKNIEVEKIVEYGEIPFDEDKLEAYQNGKPYTGVMIKRGGTEITDIYTFKNGLINGKVYKYYLNGQLNAIITLKNGVYEGESLEYYPNGAIFSRMLRSKNLLKSYIYYDEKGRVTVENEISSNRRGIVKEYYKNSNKVKYIAIGKMDDEKSEFKYDGACKVFGEDGILIAELEYKDGFLDGLPQKLYYPNGNLKYYAIAGENSTNENFTTKEKFVEYYENGKVKRDAIEQEDGSWLCKNYDKNGKYLGEKVIGRKEAKESGFWTKFLSTILGVLVRF